MFRRISARTKFKLLYSSSMSDLLRWGPGALRSLPRSWLTPVVTVSVQTPLAVPPFTSQGGLGDQDVPAVQSPGSGHLGYQSKAANLVGERLISSRFPYVPYGWFGASCSYPQPLYPFNP